MNIIYCVCGEGLGHAFRSSIVLDYLLGAGHQAVVIASGRAYDMLAARYPSVRKISGLNLIYQDNRVKRGTTILKNAVKVKDVPRNIKVIRSVVKDFKPDAVISDFEPVATWISVMYNVPLISIDNNHIISDAKLKVERQDLSYYYVSRVVVESMLPARDYSLISTFFYPPLRRRRQATTWLVPPLVRRAIQETKPEEGKHILVYQTSDSYRRLLDILKRSPERYVIYNGNREIKADNLEFRDYDPQRIVQDLAQAKGVIANGGFTLLSESLYLGKPVLSLPIQGQYEQILNGRMLEQLGYGLVSFELTPAVLSDWLAQLDHFKKNIKTIRFNNQETFEKLDEILETIRQGH